MADVTYIDTDEGVCYLHLLTDAFTHEIIDWTLSKSLIIENALETLEQAVSMFRKTDLSHLIHYSDCGVQYCCNRYVERLQELKVTICMTEDGNPTDNAIAARVNGIIKLEWLYRMKRPANIRQARILIKQIIEFYNTKRPHRSNGMKTPAQMRAAFVA